MLTGAAGIGKTRLAGELIADAVAAGGLAGRAECSEDRDAPAWWPLRQLARSIGEDPDLLLSPPIDLGADRAPFAVCERVADRLREAVTRSRPLVLLVEDVQWIDRTSAACLVHLADAMRDEPVAIVLTLRDDEDPGAGGPLLASIARGEGARQLTIGPLSREEVDALARAGDGQPIGDDELTELYELTGGNPAVRHRVDQAAAERAPAGRAASGRPRGCAAPPRRTRGECLAALRAVAVLGRDKGLDVVAQVAECDRERLIDLLDEAARESVLVSSQDRLGCGFSHQLLREGILAGMGMMQRRRLHLRAGEVLASARSGRAPRAPSRRGIRARLAGRCRESLPRRCAAGGATIRSRPRGRMVRRRTCRLRAVRCRSGTHGPARRSARGGGRRLRPRGPGTEHPRRAGHPSA